jgi:indole-3-glycerol phosphate synthase
VSSVLDQIVATKRVEIADAKAAISESAMRDRLADAPSVRDFLAPLAAAGPIKLIAEVKKASPSAGVIRADFDPVAIASIYARHGASCISVLTDEPFFQGRLEYLSRIRAALDAPKACASLLRETPLPQTPLLRKDFILDTYQLVEARAAGADAVLLIAECLDDCQLRRLHDEAIELGLTPLVEFYEPANLPRVLAAGATLVGVNNRDLRTFVTDLDHTLRLRDRVPDDCVLVSESGIRTHADVVRLERAGVHAILVGESLLAQSDIGAAVDQLMGR